MKKKLFFIITNDLFLRNYILNNTLSNLYKNYDLYLIACKETVFLKKDLLKKKNFLGFYSFSKKDRQLYRDYYLNSFFGSELKSKTMRMSLNKILKLNVFWSGESIFKSILIFPLRLLSFLKRRFSYIYFRFVYKKFFKKKKYIFKPNIELNKFFSKYNPDLVVVPTQGDDVGYYYLSIFCDKNKIETLALIDNWDNFSSRMHLKPHMSYYAGWGQQSRVHASIFQNINLKKVFNIGSARYQDYYLYRNKKIESHFTFKYILFLEGFGLTNGLEKVFENLEKILISKKEYQDLKIIYRPHPWRKDRNTINIDKYKKIVLDPQLKKQYQNKNFQTSFQPNLSYYPSLIKNAEFVIAAPTTMVIESLIFYKKIILLAHDKDTLFGHYDHLVNIEHFDGLADKYNINTCWSLDELADIFYKTYKKIKNKNNKKIIDKQINYYLYNDKNSYKTRLDNIIKKIVK
jgi:hypothetical protein